MFNLFGKKRPAHCVVVDCRIGFVYEGSIQRFVEAALRAEGVALPCVVDVQMTDDAGIQAHNRDLRGVDRPTDVLSFPMLELAPGVHPGKDDVDPGADKVFLGDICISMERVEAQAAEYGHSVERELAYLTVHATLHLLGYDHMDEGPQKAQMRHREEVILAGLGITREGS